MEKEVINGKEVESINPDYLHELLNHDSNDDIFKKTLLPKEYFDKYNSKVLHEILDKDEKPTIVDPYKFDTSSISEIMEKENQESLPKVNITSVNLGRIDQTIGPIKGEAISISYIMNVETLLVKFQIQHHLTNEDMIDGINTYLHHKASDYEIKKKEGNEP